MACIDVPPPAFLAGEECDLFARGVSRFLDGAASADAVTAWRQAGLVPREAWRKAGQAGLLCLSTSAAYGGVGGDFRHELILLRELSMRGIEGWDIPLHNAIVAPYLETYGTETQKQRWLPKMATGEIVSAIAMTEPGAGSDLQAIKTSARRDGDAYVLNGAKTFITNGQIADLILVACKTDPAQKARGISLIAVETEGAAGFSRGRNLDKIGRELADTSELFFDDVRVPITNLLGGEEGRGFSQLMEKLPQERLLIAAQSMASIEYIFELTLSYVKERKAFGKAILDFQNTQFKLAELKTEATIAQTFVHRCAELLMEGRLDSATASMAKYWVTELHGRVADECLQFFGGYGYMNEYPIAQAYRDARVSRIYGGANEIMKLLIARTL